MVVRLTEILAEYLDLDVSEISITQSFQEMGLDSLDAAELMMIIGEEFELELELSADLNTVEKVANHIEKMQG